MGLFGSALGQSTTQPSGAGMFGNGGLFGSKPAAPTMGQSQTAQPAAGTLQPSISQPVATNLPIFSMLPSSSTSSTFDQSTKKKTNLFEPMVKTPTPRVVAFQSSAQKSRGYASSSRSATPNGNLGFSLASGRPNVLNFSVSASRIGPEGFTPNAVLGSSVPKTSVKKLILDKKVDASEIMRRSSASPAPGKVAFNPALSVAAREREDSAAPQIGNPTSTRRGGARFVGPTSSEATLSGETDDKELQDGDYWSKPSIAELSKLGHEQLTAVSGLVVGRTGFGQIEFLVPVDLTTLSRLSALLGDVIRFENMECTVYPDSDEVDKPPPGTGLNERARITLLRCWPLDKATRQPIKDTAHPTAVKHVKRLQRMAMTKFESFDLNEGKWTFVVEHF
ncbi:nucleoporin autopeptidase-domain-containing protein [Vararia minispora EC-137]|uniref:Nucleoporin autopeptidase-domain-containing protein n=1 Tax=Vararia minispora EC-137 TaxID=1314806 RepID=A0ACB8QFD7_9AGAM|nr:nucleoporin autopeptidase-domain-containing protein [Vararia minispora EC-137]